MTMFPDIINTIAYNQITRFKVKSPSRQFSQSKITLHMVQLKPVTVKTSSRQFSKKIFTQWTHFKSTSIPVNQSKIPLYTVQLEPVENSAKFKIPSRQISQILLTVQSHSVLLIDISQSHLNPIKKFKSDIYSKTAWL